VGRWDNSSEESGWPFGINPKKIKYIILGGFVVVAFIVLLVFIPRLGLSVEILERNEAMHSIKTISVKVNNNNPQEIKDVVVQFGEKGKKHGYGNIGPFGAIFITPDPDEMNFEKVIVSANGGSVQTIKSR
jgi:hypothetical protein